MATWPAARFGSVLSDVERSRGLDGLGGDEVGEHRPEVPGERVHAEDDAEARRIAGAMLESGVLHRERGAEHGEERRPVVELLLLPRQAAEVRLDQVGRHRSAARGGQPERREPAEPRDPRAAGAEAVPVGVDPDTERRDHPTPGQHHATRGHSLASQAARSTSGTRTQR